MRVGLIGTSVLSTQIGEKFLSNGATSLVFFEHSHVGGAWGARKLGSGVAVAPRFNNIIFPYNPRHEKIMASLHNEFQRASLNIKLHSLGKSLLPGYGQRQVLVGSFFEAIEKTLTRKESRMIPERAGHIVCKADRVLINEKEFDYAVLLQNTPVNSVQTRDDVRLDFGDGRHDSESWIFNQSEHIRLLLPPDTPHNLPVYAESSDSVFDRFGVFEGTHNVFIGRVSREFKGQSPRDLLERFPATAQILGRGRAPVMDAQMFKQGRLATPALQALQEMTRGSRLMVVDGVDTLSGLECAEGMFSMAFHHE